MSEEMGWPVLQIKFVGKIFYLVVFENPDHRDLSLSSAPWFTERKYVYTFPWDPSFDIQSESFTKLLVWIE